MAKADLEGAKTKYPSVGMDETAWIAVFDRHPDIMWAILGDVYNVIRDEEERALGKRRMGRRPMRAAGSIDELMRTVIPPQYTTEPFSEAFRELLGTRSYRQFAMRVPCNASTIGRLLSGEWKPDMAMLESIAHAAKVPPYFFVEYRALYMGSLFERVLREQPQLGVTVFKRFRKMPNE